MTTTCHSIKSLIYFLCILEQRQQCHLWNVSLCGCYLGQLFIKVTNICINSYHNNSEFFPPKIQNLADEILIIGCKEKEIKRERAREGETEEGRKKGNNSCLVTGLGANDLRSIGCISLLLLLSFSPSGAPCLISAKVIQWERLGCVLLFLSFFFFLPCTWRGDAFQLHLVH